MIVEKAINLDLTVQSGQTSQPPWKQNNNIYSDVVLIDGNASVFSVSQTGEFLDFDFTEDVLESEAILKLNHIFDLDFDLNKFYKYLSDHEELKDMQEFCNGLRLFKAKDPFECIVSSICSANNSIKRWTRSISDIKAKWGQNYMNHYTFPNISTLGDVFADEDEELTVTGKLQGNNLKSCGVGYRSKYMRSACEFLGDDFDFSEISRMSYDEAFDTVLKIPGVGPKVADCILLYGFDFKEAFPSDVWIKRIVSHLYFNGKDIKVSKVRDFGMDEFGEYAGYVQLYMFHYARKSGLMSKLK